MDRHHLIAAQEGLTKCQTESEDGGASALLGLLESIHGPIAPGASILDLGCGVGRCVGAMLERGHDAWGVDVYEYWDRDRDLYWESEPPELPAEVTSRLRLASLVPYELPFADSSFDHIVSTQVLEHVDDLDAVFGEIARTLRPGGTSVHIFPSAWAPPIEGHIGVPFPLLCHNPAYLKLMAIAGFRSPRQRGLRWREVYRSNLEQMEVTHYPGRRKMLTKARRAGLSAEFIHDPVNARPMFARLYEKLSALGMPGAAKRILMMVQQPRLLLSLPR
ncbi:MAG: class I SAM-dependent methyltransferase [Bacillota bacterium]